MSISGFAAFSDESRHSEGQYRSLAAVSLPADSVLDSTEMLRDVIAKHGVSELKWHKVKGAKARRCALAVLNCFVQTLVPAGACADVLVWDITDSRHRIARRNDRKNFERMFFHLHKALMERRGPGADWHLRPDERLDIDWDTIRSCLTSVGGWKTYFESPLLGESISIARFAVKSFRQVASAETPLCQVADVFAGMAAYARLKQSTIRVWMEEQSGQTSLFEGPGSALALSGRDRERLPVIKSFYESCRGRALGVSLRTAGYLRTRDPHRPINFWHYTPQHESDKAPTLDV